MIRELHIQAGINTHFGILVRRKNLLILSDMLAGEGIKYRWVVQNESKNTCPKIRSASLINSIGEFIMFFSRAYHSE